MDPKRNGSTTACARLPRSRGDGPRHQSRQPAGTTAAPLTRGWTQRPAALAVVTGGCPAHAGMDPHHQHLRHHGHGLPRSRGDGPPPNGSSAVAPKAAPLTRGWTHPRPPPYRHPLGCPAHAGMDPRSAHAPAPRQRLPRSRGDGPQRLYLCVASTRAAPLTRGWTHVPVVAHSLHGGCPAHAGMDPTATSTPATVYQAAPLTRGWTRRAVLRRPADRGCPAHAGMDPRHATACSARSRLPRSRGDGPNERAAVLASAGATPLTRGWTLPPPVQAHHQPGCPAHAGMDPGPHAIPQALGWLPRSRGDGPGYGPTCPQGAEAAPLTRGWTPSPSPTSPTPPGCPAHAGMDPPAPAHSAPRAGLPRSRGDGPRHHYDPERREWAAPLTRGWTRHPRVLARPGPGCPAHAGMDPRTGR